MAPPLSQTLRSIIPIPRVSFSSASKWEGGVSMVQGSSRGIGLEFVKQLLEKHEKWHVIATCQNPNEATGLLDLKNKFAESLDILQLDLTTERTTEFKYAEVVREVAKVLGMRNASAKSIKERYGSLNLLINASRILSIPNVLQPVQKSL